MVSETCPGPCPAPSFAGRWDVAFWGELTLHVCLGQTPRSDGFAQRRHSGSPGVRCAAPMLAVPAAPCSRSCQVTAVTDAFLQKLPLALCCSMHACRCWGLLQNACLSMWVLSFSCQGRGPALV